MRGQRSRSCSAHHCKEMRKWCAELPSRQVPDLLRDMAAGSMQIWVFRGGIVSLERIHAHCLRQERRLSQSDGL